MSTRELMQVFEEELPRPLWYDNHHKLDWFVEGWINGTAMPELSTRDIRITEKSGRDHRFRLHRTKGRAREISSPPFPSTARRPVTRWFFSAKCWPMVRRPHSTSTRPQRPQDCDRSQPDDSDCAEIELRQSDLRARRRHRHFSHTQLGHSIAHSDSCHRRHEKKSRGSNDSSALSRLAATSAQPRTVLLVEDEPFVRR